MEEIESEFQALWNDFLELGEKYKEKLDIPRFGGALISFATHMLADCAPDRFTLHNLLYHAMQDGILHSEHGKEIKNDD